MASAWQSLKTFLLNILNNKKKFQTKIADYGILTRYKLDTGNLLACLVACKMCYSNISDPHQCTHACTHTHTYTHTHIHTHTVKIGKWNLHYHVGGMF